MITSVLILSAAAIVLGLGLSWFYVMCLPSCHFSIERQPSAPNSFDFAEALKGVTVEDYSSEHEVRVMAELYKRLNENRRLYQESKEDYENIIGKSDLFYSFLPLLIAPLLSLRGLKIYGFVLAGVYIGSFIIGCRIFRRKNPFVMEKDCPPEPVPPAEINTPRAFVDYWERVERVQQPSVLARCDMVFDMKKKVSEAKTSLIFALSICAVLGFLGFSTLKYTAEDLEYCREEAYAEGYEDGKDDGWDDGYEDGQWEARISCPVDIDECAQAYTGLNTAVTDLELYFDEGVRYDVNELYWNIENARLTFWELCDFIARHWG